MSTRGHRNNGGFVRVMWWVVLVLGGVLVVLRKEGLC